MVIFLGDTALDNAARFLGGVLRRLGLRFDYVPSHASPKAVWFKKRQRLFIVSDYPSKRFTDDHCHAIASQVGAGTGFLMIGGWSSYRGLGGGYQKTALAEVLPVRCLSMDDRVQGAAGYRMVRTPHAGAFVSVNFDAAPSICGYNRVIRKAAAQEILSVETLSFDRRALKYHVVKTDPLLVLGHYGHGRSAALTTDLAPHWCGGLIDWGRRRLRISPARGIAAEIGDAYFRFVKELLSLVLA